MKLATFNARAETVAPNRCSQKHSRAKRCLIPASGYYKWHDAPGGKQPYYFTRRDGQPITFAGLWSNWKNKETGESLQSCTMVIAEPNKLVAEVHDRMSVILEAKDFEQWQRGDTEDAVALMKPAAEVSKRVNSLHAPDDDPTLIERLHQLGANRETDVRNYKCSTMPIGIDDINRFIAWLEAQPENTYEWNDCEDCLFARYARKHGMRLGRAWGSLRPDGRVAVELYCAIGAGDHGGKQFYADALARAEYWQDRPLLVETLNPEITS